MKKFLIGLVALFSISIASHAQTAATTTKTAPATAKTVTIKKDHAVAAKTDKPATVKAATTSTGTAAVTKKDGTPDMRYKANKEAAAAKKTTHIKKDGTPDQRFKENKKAS